MPRRRYVVALRLIAALAVSATTAPAQRVSGTVRDSAAGAPVGGAVVWLSDSSGGVLVRTIGSEAGAFTMARPRGAIRLHVARIGYRPRDLLIAVGDSTHGVALAAIPAFLETMSASSRRVCPGDRGSSEGFELWEQARAALLASVVAREAQPPRIRLISYSRTMEPTFNRLKHQETSTKELTVERSYVAARPAWAFAYEGYMREDGSERIYYAPDNETLLDPSFAGTHCLQMAPANRDHADQVGIAFEPVRDNARDTLVDVRGVLWLDRKTPALRTLEFTYTGLEGEARDSGGEITFGVMHNGVPMVERWIIRTAIVAMDVDSRDLVRRALPRRELRRNVRVVGIKEVGGEVASVKWPDGSAWHGRLPRITGVIVDGDGRPVGGARVWAMKSTDTVITNREGRFALPVMLPGAYALLASDSILAAAGVSRTATSWVIADRERDADVVVVYHPRSAVLRLLCPTTYRAGTGVVLGRVVSASGEPLAKAQVDVWRRIISANVELFHQEPGGVAGDDGKFVICGASLTEQLKLRATGAGAAGETMIESWPDEVALVTIVVRQ